MKIVNRKKFIRSTAIVIFLLVGIFNISIAKPNKEEAKILNYTVSRGETLWSIASKYTPNTKDTRETIREIKKLNNMTASTVYENQTIKIKKGQ